MLRNKTIKAVSTLFFLVSCMILLVFPASAATVRVPTASGTTTYGTGTVTVDASNTKDGYIMVKYTGKAPKIKVRVKKTVDYTYDLNTSGQYETFPLSEGSGDYMVMVFENVNGKMYSTAFTQKITVKLENENNPFLFPNQFCNYNAETRALATGDELVKGKATTLEKVGAVYQYAIDNITYDYHKAATVQSGYLPTIDDTLDTKTGICFDYSALMTAILRSQDIPTKLEIGYAGNIYHAWISVFTTEQGWVNNVIQFDGTNWRFMDPTFAASGKGDPKITEYITNSANYMVKFSY